MKPPGHTDHGAFPEAFDSEEEAQREALKWLSYLVEKGRYDWKWAGSARLKTQPASALPVRLFADRSPFSDGGWGPSFAMMAGRKFSGCYWQYTTCDPISGRPHPPEKAIEDIEDLLDCFVRVVAFRNPKGKSRRERGRAVR